MGILRSCPVCCQNNAMVLYRPRRSPGEVARCRGCGLVYVAEIENRRALIFDGPVTGDGVPEKVLTSANLDDVEGSWEFYHLPDREAEWGAIRQNALSALARIERHAGRKPGSRLLDVGAGWGFFLAAAKERGWQAHGLEPLPASAVFARATFGVEVVTDTLRPGTFAPGSFDVVTAFQVFEHLPDPSGDLRQIHGLLREGGLVTIEVPNIDTWTVRLLGPRHRHFVPDHVNFFSRATLERLLRVNGFQPVDTFFPTRRMSVCHLVRHWFPRYLPSRAAHAVERALAPTRMWSRTIGLNTGDILAVIARKVDTRV